MNLKNSIVRLRFKKYERAKNHVRYLGLSGYPLQPTFYIQLPIAQVLCSFMQKSIYSPLIFSSSARLIADVILAAFSSPGVIWSWHTIAAFVSITK